MHIHRGISIVQCVLNAALTFSKDLTSFGMLAVSRNASVILSSLGFRLYPFTHVQFTSKAHRAETKF